MYPKEVSTLFFFKTVIREYLCIALYSLYTKWSNLFANIVFFCLFFTKLFCSRSANCRAVIGKTLSSTSFDLRYQNFSSFFRGTIEGLDHRRDMQRLLRPDHQFCPVLDMVHDTFRQQEMSREYFSGKWPLSRKYLRFEISLVSAHSP